MAAFQEQRLSNAPQRFKAVFFADRDPRVIAAKNAGQKI
jgi:hypothetical protein